VAEGLSPRADSISSEELKSSFQLIMSGDHIPLVPDINKASKEDILLSALSQYERSRKYLNVEEEAARFVLYTRRIGNLQNEIGKYFHEEGDLEQAEVWWRRGVEAFESVRDGSNAALLRCNIGKIISARCRKRKESDGELSTEARALYAQAIEMHSKAYQDLGDRHANPGIWNLVHMELAGLFMNFSQDLSDQLFHERKATELATWEREDGQLVVDMLMKAQSLYQSAGAAFNKAESHTALGCFYAASLYASAVKGQSNVSSKKQPISRPRFDAAEGQFRKALSLSVGTKGGWLPFFKASAHLANLFRSAGSLYSKVQALKNAAQTLLVLPRLMPRTNEEGSPVASQYDAVGVGPEGWLDEDQFRRGEGFAEVLGSVRGLLKDLATLDSVIQDKVVLQKVKRLYLESLRLNPDLGREFVNTTTYIFSPEPWASTLAP